MARPKSELTDGVYFNCRIERSMEDELFKLSRKVGVPRSKILRMACKVGMAHVSKTSKKAKNRVMAQIKSGNLDLGSVNRELEREIERELNSELHKLILQEQKIKGDTE